MNVCNDTISAHYNSRWLILVLVVRAKVLWIGHFIPGVNFYFYEELNMLNFILCTSVVFVFYMYIFRRLINMGVIHVDIF